MHWLQRIQHRLQALFQKSKLDADLTEEMRAHIEMRTRQNIAAGMPSDEARYAAMRQFGWVENIKETCREQRGITWPENFLQDARYGVRMLVKNPGFTAVGVLTLALGVGANTAIFSVVNGVLLKPLPYHDPGRIVTVLHDGWGPVAPADFLDWRSQNRSFERMAAAEAWGGTLTGGDRPEAIPGIRLGEGLLELLGVPPLFGRMFQADDYQPGHDRVLILSYALWIRHFGASPSVIGQTVTLDSQPYTVIGIMPRDFRFAPFWVTKSEMWAPLSLTERANRRDWNSLRVFARLMPGVSRERAQADMDTICRRLEQAYPDTNKGRTVRVDSLLDKVVGDIRRALLVLLGAVVFVLLIACANVANLLLVRAAAREKEMAIRTALGAGRWRTIRQLLTESLVLASLAGLLGLAAGFFGVIMLKSYLQGSASTFTLRLPRVEDITIDPPTLLFSLAIALLTGLVFGLAPALHAAKADLQGTLKESGRSMSSGQRSRRVRAALVVAEVGLALVMLSGAGLLMRSFLRLAAVDPGFEPKNVLTMTVSLAGQNDFVGPKRIAFYEQLFQRIEALPGVQSASAVNHLPLAGDAWGFGITIEGRPLPAAGEGVGAVFRVCRPRYCRTMGMSFVRGRDFSNQDGLGSPGVVIINENLARRQFANDDPLGKRLTLDDPRGNPNWLTIVGVVKDAKQTSWTGEPSNEIYLPWSQSKGYVEETGGHIAYMTLVIRTAGYPRSLVGAVQSAVWGLNRNAPVSSIMTMEEVVANAVWQQRFNLVLIGLFAALALVLATVGIYGVMAYSVAQRTQEIGIRLALGAQRGDLVRLVVTEGMRLTVLGLVIGLFGALALTRMMTSLLYQVNTTDPVTFAGVIFALASVSVLACYLPARRATRVDPMVALRHE